MTTFSFSTGNPSNLTGGATASMTDISGSLTDLKTFINGNITDTNVTAGGLTDTSLASPTSVVWRTILTTQMPIASISTSAYYASTNGMNASGAGSSLTIQGLWTPPVAGDIAVTGKTTRLRLRVPWLVNGTAPGINMTWGLYPITTVSGSGVVNATLGTVVAGSTVAQASGGFSGGGVATGSSFDFTAVTAGNPYVIGVTGSGAQAVNSVVNCQPLLEMRHT